MTTRDFDKLECNPLSLSEGELMQEKYSFFSKRVVFTEPLCEIASESQIEENPDIEQDNSEVLSDLLKFIVLFVDEDSPFYDTENFDERIEHCLTWANIKPMSRAAWHIHSSSEWYLNLESYYFLYTVDNQKYADWHAKNRSIMSMRRFLSTPIERSENPESTVKAQLLITQNLDKETEKMTTLQAQVFPKNLRLQKRLKRQIENLEATKERVISYAEIKAKPVPR